MSTEHTMGPAPLLLLSMPQMADPNFARSVVLLCDYTDRGAFGLIVNRQMDEFAHAVVKTDPKSVDPALRLFVGGPVDAHSTWIVMAESQGLTTSSARSVRAWCSQSRAA